MNEIEITIRGNSSLEVLAQIGAFGLRCLQNDDVRAAAKRLFAAEQAKDYDYAAAPEPAETTPEP